MSIIGKLNPLEGDSGEFLELDTNKRYLIVVDSRMTPKSVCTTLKEGLRNIGVSCIILGVVNVYDAIVIYELEKEVKEDA